MPGILIVIPARYESTRLPGKPLVNILGVPMVQRVAAIARGVCGKNDACDYVVATDHEKIMAFCRETGIPCLMTPEWCQSGSERCREAVKAWPAQPDFVVNLQGDNPICQPHFIQALIDAWKTPTPGGASGDVFTPAIRLTWDDLRSMEEAKLKTKFSGTTVTVTRNGYASYFSKTIIPAVRKPDKAREAWPDASPVRRHVGLYAYTREALEAYFAMEESPYEKSFTEGLEQNRFLWNEMRVRVVDVDPMGRPTSSGVDSPEDVDRVEKIIREYGELLLD